MGVAARAGLAAVAACAALAAPRPAPGPAAVAAAQGAPATADGVDWARGLVIARAVGTADRRAPSPTVARVGSLREAEDRARAALVAAARALPVAGGGTVGDALDADAAAAARLAAAAGTLVEVETQWLPDGSVRLRRGLAVEAIRQALAGPRAVAPAWAGADRDADAAPTSIVVDATGVAVTPAVGVELAVGQGGAATALPAVWRAAAPKDRDKKKGSLLGARPARARATAAAGATLVLEADADVDLAAAAAAGAAVIVVVSEDR